MRAILAARCVRREPPGDDLMRWARAYATSPATTQADRRHRAQVAALLTEVRAGR